MASNTKQCTVAVIFLLDDYKLFQFAMDVLHQTCLSRKNADVLISNTEKITLQDTILHKSRVMKDCHGFRMKMKIESMFSILTPRLSIQGIIDILTNPFDIDFRWTRYDD